MYGRLRVIKGIHSEKEIALYRKYYCGLCCELKRKYGWPYRFLVSHDVATAYMLVGALANNKTQLKGRCFARPYKSMDYITNNEIDGFFADITVLLAYFNALDDIQDGEFKISSWLIARLLKSKAEKLSNERSALYDAIHDGLLLQEELESKEEGTSLLDACIPFGTLLGASVSLAIKDDLDKELMRILFYWIGCWIYLIDACEDVKKDIRHNNYNPLVKEEGASFHDIKMSRHRELVETILLIKSNIMICLRMYQRKDEKEILQKMIERGITKKAMNVLEVI